MESSSRAGKTWLAATKTMMPTRKNWSAGPTAAALPARPRRKSIRNTSTDRRCAPTRNRDNASYLGKAARSAPNCACRSPPEFQTTTAFPSPARLFVPCNSARGRSHHEARRESRTDPQRRHQFDEHALRTDVSNRSGERGGSPLDFDFAMKFSAVKFATFAVGSRIRRCRKSFSRPPQDAKCRMAECQVSIRMRIRPRFQPSRGQLSFFEREPQWTHLVAPASRPSFARRRRSSRRYARACSAKSREAEQFFDLALGRSGRNPATQSTGACGWPQNATRILISFDHFRCFATAATVRAGKSSLARVFRRWDSVRKELSRAFRATCSGPCAISPPATRDDPRFASINL